MEFPCIVFVSYMLVNHYIATLNGITNTLIVNGSFKFLPFFVKSAKINSCEEFVLFQTTKISSPEISKILQSAKFSRFFGG